MTLSKMSFYGAVIILAIIIIRAFTLHKLPKRTFLILWGIALLRLLVPFEIASEFSIYSLLPEKETVYVPEDPFDPFRNYADSLDYTELPAGEGTIITEENNGTIYLPIENPDGEAILLPNPESGTPVTVENATTNTTSSNADLDDTSDNFPLFPVLWAVGLLLSVAFFLSSYGKCYREFRTSLPVEETHAAEWLKKHSLKRKISIRQSDKISAPLTYGLFRPVILLPKQTDWNNKEQLDYVLYHEFTHIRRFDLAAKLIMTAALCLHWFNPLVWGMYFFFNRDLELSCDECVVKHFNKSKADYANTLIGMEEKKNYSTLLCNHFSKNAIEERITAIMKSKKTTIGMVITAVVLIIVVVVTLTTGPKEETTATDITPTVTPAETTAPTVPPTSAAEPTPPPGALVFSPETNYTYSNEDSLAKFDYNSSTISPTDGYDFIISTFVSKEGEPILSDLTLHLEPYAGTTAWWCLAAFYDKVTESVYLEFVPAAGVEEAPSGILHVTIPVENPAAYTVLQAGDFHAQKASAFWFSDICKIKNRIYFNNGCHYGSLWVFDLTTGEMSDLAYVNEKMQELANELCADFGWKHEPAIWFNVSKQVGADTYVYTASVCKEMDTDTIYTLDLWYEEDRFVDFSSTYHGSSEQPPSTEELASFNYDYLNTETGHVYEESPASIPHTTSPDWYAAVEELLHGNTPVNTIELPHDIAIPSYVSDALSEHARNYLALCGLGTTHHANCYAVCQTGNYMVYAADISYSPGINDPDYFTVYHAYDDGELVGKVILRHLITFYDTENLSHAWENYINMDDVVTMAKEQFEEFYNSKNYNQPCEITSIHMTSFETMEVEFLIPESDNFNIYTEAEVEFTYDFATETWSVSHFRETPPDYLGSYAEFPTFPAGDAVVAETGWNLTYLDELHLPSYSHLKNAGATFETETANNHNIGMFHTAALNGIYYFFVEEDADDHDALAWHIAITSPDYPLSGGAKVGMTVDELLALYPALAKTNLTYDDPAFETLYGPSMFNFRDDQFPASFLAEYDYAYVAYLDKGRDGLPVCIAFLIKNNQVGAITVYLPTAG